MATAGEKKALPGDGDIGAPDSEAREDSIEHSFFVVPATSGRFKKFLAPAEKYANVLTELGIEKFDPTQANSKKAFTWSGLYAPKIRVTLKDDKTTASLTLFCSINKLGTALEAIVGKKVYSYTILSASVPRKQTLS